MGREVTRQNHHHHHTAPPPHHTQTTKHHTTQHITYTPQTPTTTPRTTHHTTTHHNTPQNTEHTTHHNTPPPHHNTQQHHHRRFLKCYFRVACRETQEITMECHGDLAGRGVGSAWRRRERRLRAALRHEQQTVVVVSCPQPATIPRRWGADVVYAAPRNQETDRTAGRRPGVLLEPEPPGMVERAVCPCSGAPLLVVPSLAAAGTDGVDGTTTRRRKRRRRRRNRLRSR